MSIDELREKAAAISWYHTIDLGGGVVTPGVVNNRATLKRIRLPENLAGKTVIDIGAWDGFFSFEAERLGGEVLATDYFCWGHGGWGTKEGFLLARSVLDSKVKDLDIDVLDISPQSVGVFDVTLFLGVFYHLRHPLLALERIASITKELLVLETVVDCLHCGRPALAFYPGSELNNDPTNWFGPNPAAVVGMLKSVGFSNVRMVSTVPSLPTRILNALGMSFFKGASFFPQVHTARAAFHARRD